MNEIIGGTFPLNQNQVTAQGNKIYLANARCAFNVICNETKAKTIWLPNYYCPSMLDAFKSKEIKHYSVDNKLKIPDEIKVKNGELIVFIDYFGWPTDPIVIKSAKEKGAIVAMDMSQSLFRLPNVDSDFIVYSPRKFIPIPDGGILICLKNTVKLDLEACPIQWWCRQALAMDYRNRNELDNQTWYAMFKEAKQYAPVGCYAISEFSKNILENTNTDFIIKNHIANYKILLDHLKTYALFDTLPLDVVPLGFPVVVQNRNNIQKLMFKENIFPSIHWEVDHPLSRNIMTLPCDSTYNSSDMQKVIEVFLASVDLCFTSNVKS